MRLQRNWPLTSSPEAFAKFQKVEQERWTKIIKEHDIKGD